MKKKMSLLKSKCAARELVWKAKNGGLEQPLTWLSGADSELGMLPTSDVSAEFF